MAEGSEAVASLARGGRIFLGTVIAAGTTVIAASVFRLHVEPVSYQWYILAALTLISGSATVKLPSVPASISVSETFVFSSVLLFGSAAGTVTVALDGLVISFWMAKRRPEWYRALFNMSAPAISIWVASQLLFNLAGVQPLIQQAASVNTLLLPLLSFAIVYFGLNSWLIAFAVAFETGTSPYRVWRENFLWLSLNYFSGASVALLLVVYTRDVDVHFIGVIVPLLLVLYFTFKTSMGRVADANSHLQQLNRLYLSTIETLAMAIDAKDQITHGHIRRVQALAVMLARKVGVADERLIKAIEAAALLHDTGKLAVPEYILNKPGALTAAEFEKMKLHASVGADILTAIDFPYPVVPIVRHHHENWNGTGYPARLKGTEIPIGARILAVVDCFDALTSDRPYRPRLTDDEALRIVIDRRGSMYDPLIVDTFLRVHRESAIEAPSVDLPRHALHEITSAVKPPVTAIDFPRFDDIAASSDEMLTMYELARALGDEAGVAEIGDIVAKHLRHLIPSDLCVLYSYDARTDELEASHALGDAAPVVKGTRIELGQRLSGWVGANRQTIVNSDPILDLGEAARAATPRLRSSLSAPLSLGDELVGVITLYSSVVSGFTEDHRRVVESVSRHIAQAFKRARDFDQSQRSRVLTGLPDREHEQFADTTTALPAQHAPIFALLLMNIVGLDQITVAHGQESKDEVLRHVVRQARSYLRSTDTLFRYGRDEFIAFLNDADVGAANELAAQIDHNFQTTPLTLRTQGEIYVDVRIATVGVPQEGQSLGDLIRVAQRRLGLTPSRESTIH